MWNTMSMVTKNFESNKVEIEEDEVRKGCNKLHDGNRRFQLTIKHI